MGEVGSACAARCGDVKLAVRVGWGGLAVGLGLGSMKGSSRETQETVVVLLNTYSRDFLVGEGMGCVGQGIALWWLF